MQGERVSDEYLWFLTDGHDGVPEKMGHMATELLDLRAEVARLKHNLEAIRRTLEDAVCTEGIDKGIILLSEDGPTHREEINGQSVTVYDHEYFSPLGDKLIEAWELTEPAAFEDREKLRDEWLAIVRNTLVLKEGDGVVDAIERLQQREPYVQHLPGCKRSGTIVLASFPCTCGLSKLAEGEGRGQG